VPFFFDLSSAFPLITRNPFEPVVVADEVPAEPVVEEIPAEPIIDTGLPIPAHYDIDLMRAVVQDPFHLFVYWQLKDNPYDRLRRIFPANDVESFHTALKLIDETSHIAVYFDAAFAREYWFSVFPDRRYRVELGLRSPRFGWIKQLASAPVTTPRGAPSDQAAEEPQYQIAADEYVQVLRESHLVPERAFTPEGLVRLPGETAAERAAVLERLPESFRRLLNVIADAQAGRDYDRLWERLEQAELAALVREFVNTMRGMGQGELGYMLLLRYLPELLRRAIADAGETEIETDKPITLWLAEKLGQTASEYNFTVSSVENVAPGLGRPDQWSPSRSV
jgi:hypothetical protein